MTCCNCWNNFVDYVISYFVKNEDQIKKEMVFLAEQILPILLPIIKQEVENIINQKIPTSLQIPVDNIINKVL